MRQLPDHGQRRGRSRLYDQLRFGTLTIAPAPLVITADDQQMTYGATLPALTVSYSGLVNGDTAPDTLRP